MGRLSLGGAGLAVIATCLALPASSLAAAPPVPTADSFTVIDATDATLSGDIQPNGLDTTYYFEYAPSNNTLCGGADSTPPTITSTGQVAGSNTDSPVSATVPQSGKPPLTAGAAYCFAVVATNGDALSGVTSSSLSFVSGAPNAQTYGYAITGAQTADITYTGDAAGQSAQVKVAYDELNNADNWCQNIINNGTLVGSPAHTTTATAFPFSDDQSHSNQTLSIGGLTAGTSYCALISISNGSVPAGVMDPTSWTEFTAGAPTVSTQSVVSTSAKGASVQADINPNGQTGVSYVAEWDTVGSTFCSDPINNSPSGTGGTTTPATMPSSDEATETINFTVGSANQAYCVLVVATAGTVKDTQDVNYADSQLDWTSGVPLATTDSLSGEGTGPTSGQITGTVNPAGDGTTTYDAEYWLETTPGTCPSDTTPTGTTAAKPLGAGDATAHAVTVAIGGLAKNQSYCAEVVAQNATGSSTSAANGLDFPVEFSTGAPAVDTTSADPVGAATATINGDVNPENDATTQYWVAYDVNTSSFCQTQNTADVTIHTTSKTSSGLTSLTSSNPVNVDLAGLTTGTEYCAEVVAQNASGTSYGSPGVTFTPTAPPPSAFSGSATPTGGTTETLTGDVNPNGQATQYQFQYALNGSAFCLANPHTGASQSSPATPASAGSGTGDVSVNTQLTGLSPGQEYCWSLVATYGASGSVVSDGSNFQVGLPGATTSAASAITNTGAIMNGEVDPENYSTAFAFDYGPASSDWCTSGGIGVPPYATPETAVPGTTDTSEHAVSASTSAGGNPGLTPGTTYCFELTASNTVGSNTGTMLTFTTTGAGPNANHTLTVTDSGTGAGKVTSSPSGISCPGTCSASFPGGSTVSLSEAPAAGSTFTGWGGSCSGTGACSVTLGSNETVTATFTKNPAPSCSLALASGKVLLKKHKKGPLKKVKPDTVTLTADCDQSASGVIAGRATVKGKKPKHGKAKTTTYSFSVSADLSAGVPKSVVVSLPGAAISGLSKGATETVVFTLTATDANGRGVATAGGALKAQR